MADVEALKNALVAAHNAGDTEAANMFADQIKQMQGPQTIGEAVGTGAENLIPQAVSGAGKAADAVMRGLSFLNQDPRAAAKYATEGVLNSADALSTAGAGGLINAASYIPGVEKLLPKTPQVEQARQAARSVGSALIDPYRPGQFYKTLANDPWRPIVDASMLATGGEGLAARGLGESALLTRALGKAAAITNPMTLPSKVVGGVIGKVLGTNPVKLAADAAPTGDQIATDTANAYATMTKDAQGNEIMFNNQAVRNKAAAINRLLKDKAITPESAPIAYKYATQFNNAVPKVTPAQIVMGGNGQVIRIPAKAPPVRMADLEAIRQDAGVDMAASKSAEDRKYTAAVRSAIDDLYNKHPSVDPNAVATARELGRRNILNRNLNEVERISEWNRMGPEASQRSQIGQMGKRQGKNLTPLEEAALKEVALGSTPGERVTGALGQIGRFTPTGLIAHLAATGAGGLLTGGLGTFLYPAGTLALGKASQRIADYLAKGSFNRAQGVIRAGKPGQLAAEALAAKNAATARLLREAVSGGGLLGVVAGQGGR